MTTMTTTPEPLLTLDEVADYLGVTNATVYRWNRTGEGPAFYRVGKNFRYRMSDIQQWLESNKGGGAA